MPYALNEQAGQIIGPLGTVVADVHGLGTADGRRDVETMLRALNADPARMETLSRIRRDAIWLAESGQATEDGFRRLAALVADLAKEVAG